MSLYFRHGRGAQSLDPWFHTKTNCSAHTLNWKPTKEVPSAKQSQPAEELVNEKKLKTPKEKKPEAQKTASHPVLSRFLRFLTKSEELGVLLPTGLNDQMKS